MPSEINLSEGITFVKTTRNTFNNVLKYGKIQLKYKK